METVEQFDISKLRVLKNLGPLYFMENCLIFVLHKFKLNKNGIRLSLNSFYTSSSWIKMEFGFRCHPFLQVLCKLQLDRHEPENENSFSISQVSSLSSTWISFSIIGCKRSVTFFEQFLHFSGPGLVETSPLTINLSNWNVDTELGYRFTGDAKKPVE